MRVGDILEWLCACAFTAGAYLKVGLAWSVIVAGVCLYYLAQGYAKSEFPRVRLPKIPRPRLGRKGRDS